jgi:cyclopropane fatty-acyl-phospholipid synthase-like methyltransferase
VSFPDAKDFWDGRYAAEGYLFGTEPNRCLVAQAHHLKAGQSVLSIADGEGRNGVWLAQQGLDVTAFDVSPVAVAKARRLAELRGVSVRFEVSDVESWEWGAERWDAIVAVFIQFAAPPLRERIFARVREALKPGGTLLLHGYTPQQIEYKTGGPPHAENMYTEALLRQAFGDFELLRLAEYEDELGEGSGHSGRSAVIDLVARKPL